MAKARWLLGVLTGCAASAAIPSSEVLQTRDIDSEQNPMLELDFFQVADLTVLDPLKNINLADVGGAVHVLHTKIVVESLRHVATAREDSRISGVNGINSFRFKVRNPQKILAETRHSLLSDFGPYITYENGVCNSTSMGSLQSKFGNFVGLKRQLDQRFPLPPDSPIFRFSIPEGGVCLQNETFPDPTGSANCTYAYNPAPANVSLDELVGITLQDCGGRTCTDFADWRSKCTDKSYMVKFNFTTLGLEETTQCIEYDIHPDCIDSCIADKCAKRIASGEEIEVGLGFWRGRCNAEANRRRVELTFAAFSPVAYESTKLLVDEDVLFLPALCLRPESPKACHAHGPTGGPYCFRGFSGLCQPCYVPNATSADFFRHPACPLVALKTPEYSDASNGLEPLKCRTAQPADLCCLYDASCDGDDDPLTAAFTDDAFILVAARQSTDDMVTFFGRVAQDRYSDFTVQNDNLMLWASKQWHSTPRPLDFEKAASELKDCCLNPLPHHLPVVAIAVIMAFLVLAILAAIARVLCTGKTSAQTGNEELSQSLQVVAPDDAGA